MTRAEVRDLIEPLLVGWTVHAPVVNAGVELRAPVGYQLTMATLDQVAKALGTRLIDVGSAGYWYGEHGVQLTVRWP